MSPLMIDLHSYSLTAEEVDLLQHPLVGGVILFSRNFEDRAQLTALTAQIRESAKKPLLISVDHEGGRVQRFREGFSEIPSMAAIYEAVNGNLASACDSAQTLGWLMASEVMASDIDFSFAPVVDINGLSTVIGDRAFHTDPDVVVTVASAFIRGMRSAGMKSTGKHFPGHGSVVADSHIALPVDERSRHDIFNLDMKTFVALNRMNLLDAVMPAHVIYPDVDSVPAGFSRIWLQKILRQQMNFNGVIFSDDLSMEAAVASGCITERLTLAMDAGCDMALICNDRKSTVEALDNYKGHTGNARLATMAKTSDVSWDALENSQNWKSATEHLKRVYQG